MASDKPKKPAVTLKTADLSKMSKHERIKAASDGLFFVSDGRGEPHTFLDEVQALSRGEKETISGEAKELSKFFGVYQQQQRGERGKKLDDHFFMVRLKLPDERLLPHNTPFNDAGISSQSQPGRRSITPVARAGR